MAVPVEGVLVDDLKRVVRTEFRSPDHYSERHVAPALVDRGLLWMMRERRRSRVAEFDWTVAGREADAQLTRWLELGNEHLADWVARVPARAAAFTREAGSAVFLMRDHAGAFGQGGDAFQAHGLGLDFGGNGGGGGGG